MSGGDTSYAVHNINTTMKYKDMYIPYEFTVTTVEKFSTTDLNTILGTPKKTQYSLICKLDPAFSLSGYWKLKIENNSDIDLDFYPKYDDETTKFTVKAHGSEIFTRYTANPEIYTTSSISINGMQSSFGTKSFSEFTYVKYNGKDISAFFTEFLYDTTTNVSDTQGCGIDKVIYYLARKDDKSYNEAPLTVKGKIKIN